MPPERIDAGWIRSNGASVLHVHLNMVDQSQSSRRVIDRRDGTGIGLGFTDVIYKRKKCNGAKSGTGERVWWVDSHTGEIATLDEALEILAIIRAGDEIAS